MDVDARDPGHSWIARTGGRKPAVPSWWRFRGIAGFDVAPWQGDPEVAILNPRGLRTPLASRIREAVDRLGERGVCRVVTPALSPGDAGPFVRAGFRVRETLCLLRLELGAPVPVPTVPVEPGRRRDIAPALAVDRAAFEGFWCFDRRAFDEARRATIHHAFRVTRPPSSASGREGDGVVGYAICGRSDRRGYLQRLAVHPDLSGSGRGASLVLDACDWLWRGGARVVFVNTQQTNHRALGLYQRLGFVIQPEGLQVLEWRAT